MANGMTEEDLGLYVDVLMDGRKIGEFKPEQQKKIDLVLRSSAGDIKTPEDIANSLIANGDGNLIRIRDVADLAYSQGMVQINHRERKRNITLQVTPPMEIPLQAALETITTDIVVPLRDGGKLPGTTVSVGGNADKLSSAIAAIQWNLILAAVIIYLLMSALFENFLLPADHHVQRTHGRGRRPHWTATGGPVHRTAAIRYSNHAGIHHLGGHGGEQRDFNCAPSAQQCPLFRV
jgi:HAE1 family hydrophobic/amphiphilic exporter-1